MAAVAVDCLHDAVLDAVAPIVLASAHDTALVVDLGEGSIVYPGEHTLAALVNDGPRLVDLTPDRKGLAVLPNGGVGVEESAEVIWALIEGWPLVVLRGRADQFGVHIPVVPLYPGVDQHDPAVFVSTGLIEPIDADSLVVPGPSRATARRVIGGGSAPRRLVSAWEKVWSHPWR